MGNEPIDNGEDYGGVEVSYDSDEGELLVSGEVMGFGTRLRLKVANKYTKWVAIGIAIVATVVGGLAAAGII